MSFTTKSSGTTNTMPKYTDPNTLGNSNQTDDGTTFTVGKRTAFTPISPASLSVDQNDYAIGDATILHLTSSADVNITGFTGGTSGRVLRVYNDGSNIIVLINENASSTTANRFHTAIATGLSAFDDVVIWPDNFADLVYDGSISRWRVAAAVVGFGGAGSGNYDVAVWNVSNGSNTLVGSGGNLEMTPGGAIRLPVGATIGTTLEIASNGQVITYDSVTTAGKGVVPIHDVVQLTGQTGAISLTAFQNGNPTGLYRVSCYALSYRDGSAGSSVEVRISWQDTGAMRTETCGSVLPLDADGFTHGDMFIYNVTGGFGTVGYDVVYASDGTYDLFLTLEKLSN